VVTWNGAHLLTPCLESLRAQDEPHHLVIVDNASADQTAQLLCDRYPEAQVVRLAINTGFAGGAQAGLDAITTGYVAFLNNDAIAQPGWLRELVAALDADQTIAAATSRLVLLGDGRINNAGGALTRWGAGYDRGYGAPDGPPYDQGTDVAAFCGGACLLRTEAAREVGGFPTEFFLYYEDMDLSWRLGRAGWRIRYVPTAIVHHAHSATSDQASASFAFYNQRNQLLMLVRNAPWSVTLGTLARFVAVTVVRTLRPTAGHTARPAHRLSVLLAFAKRLPVALRQRKQLQALAVRSRRDFTRRWLGTEARSTS
jgi:GT2 family glycosyltransferase